MLDGGFVEKKFPSECLVPKNETGAWNFLQKYPEYNGDGVTIAIFDTGVDPKAAGLMTLPDGSPKVIERFDCSGSGDVDMLKKVTASADGTLIGLSGRTLKLTNDMKMKNTAGDEYRIGLKCLYELYPSKVKDKIMSDFKLKHFNEPHKLAIADAARQIELFEAANPNIKDTNQSLPLKDKLRKDDLDNQLEYLNGFEKKFNDLKTTLDCILYETIDGWTAVIDTTECGDLSNAIFLTEYSKTHMIKSLNDYISVSMNVHDGGNVLEIVGCCSNHGTHVAAIAAANYPENALELNGIAPGAKIVSLTIADSRLVAQETGAALIRAMIKVMELCNAGKPIHVINMSFGEHSHWINSSRVNELMSEISNKYGVVWVLSAGNSGPAITTVTAPAHNSEGSLIGVGAYVSPGMMEAEYAMRLKLPANVYTWTSRDPCSDGGQAVTVCAPGAAIASVPEMTLMKHQLMNGTSMASPHVAGAIAVIISGLLKSNIAYSPYSIKRALANTATFLDYVDRFAQGYGLLNVEKAFDYLTQHKDESENEIRFTIRIGAHKDKGIYLRDGCNTPREFSVTVEPIFCNDTEIPPARKLNFNRRLTLIPSDPWVQCGSFLDLSYAARTILVRVDPTSLPIGVHATRVRAYDSANIAKGSLFDIPVTVVIPIHVDVSKTKSVSFETSLYKPNTIKRFFIMVPNHATWATLRLRSPDCDPSVPAKYLVHTMQCVRNKTSKTFETSPFLPISNQVYRHAFKCQENNILEICISKFWSDLNDCSLEASVEFRGIWTNGQNTMHSANGIYRMDLTTLFTEDIKPEIQLNTAVMVLKPTEIKITPLSGRDILPPGRQIYQNILTYNLHLPKNQEVAVHAPLFNDLLYESAFESQFWMLFDVNKMMVACGDSYTSGNFVKLDKGDYAIRMQVRHEKKELLEKISDATMLIAMKLSSNIAMDFYLTYNNAITASKKLPLFQMRGGVTAPIYVAPLSSEKGIPNQCSWLEGTITFAKDEPGRKTDTRKFQYILTEGPGIKKANGALKDNKSKWNEYRDSVRDLALNMLSKLELDKAQEVYAEMIQEFPDYLPAHIAMLQKWDSIELKNQLPFTFKKSLNDKSLDLKNVIQALENIIKLANLVIDKNDTDTLLAYYGLKSDTRADAAKIKQNMDKQKSTLLEAYVKKAIAMSKLRLIEMFQNKEFAVANAEWLDELDNIYSEVGKFIDYADIKVILLTLWHGFMHQQYGRMLKALQKQYEEKLQRDALEELVCVTNEMGLSHISAAVKKIAVSANPGGYRPF